MSATTFTTHAAKQYLNALFDQNDIVCLTFIHGTRTYHNGGAVTENRFLPLSEIISEQGIARLTKRNEGWHIYVSMAPFKLDSKNRTKANIAEVRHVFMEADENGDAVLAAVRTAVAAGDIPAPTIIVQSSPHKFQFIWNITGFTIPVQEALNRTLQQKFGTDAQAVDAARVLRIAGFRNIKPKYGDPKPVAEIVEYNEPPLMGITIHDFHIPMTSEPDTAVYPVASDAAVQESIDFLESAMDAASVSYTRKPWDGSGGAYKFPLALCPWRESHETGGPSDAIAIVQPTGAYGFKCLHDHCSNRSWDDFRTYLESLAGRRLPFTSNGKNRVQSGNSPPAAQTAETGTIDGLFAAAHLNPLADEVLVLEGDKDVAVARSHGFNATGILSTQSKLSKADITLLSKYKRVYLIGDQDIHGIEAMDRIAKQLPEAKAIRVRLQVNDIGALYEDGPLDFEYQLQAILRDACTTRRIFEWDDLLEEDEIIRHQGVTLKYAIDQIAPLRRITMLYGQEKSCKSLIALYAGKCVANGVRFLDTYATRKMPVLYIDAEHGVVGEYLVWLQKIGEGLMRFRTLETGIPALDDPCLLKICEELKPLIIIDSLHKFNTSGGTSWASSVMEPIMAKIQRLTTLGATVILVHHAVRAEADRYADSFAIGANVDFLIAVVAQPPEPNGVRKITLIGKPSRGAVPPTLKLIAFPHLKTLGKMVLDGDPVKSDKELVYEFIGANPQSNTRAIRIGVKVNHDRVDEIIRDGVKSGELVVSDGARGAKQYELKRLCPEGRARSNDDSLFPEAGTVGARSDLIEVN